MRYFSKTITAAALATLVACGDSTGPAAEQNDPGTGTATLRVDARIDGQDAVGGFITEFIVSVLTGDGLPVSGADVTIQNGQLGEVTLLEAEVGSGVYRAERNSFPDGDFRLDVVSGDDNVRNVIVGGIGIHEITAPLAEATITAGAPLTVTWDAPALARGVEIETRDYESPVLADNGEAVIAAENNPERAEQRIRVYRFNEVDILGGLAESEFRVTIRNTVEPLTVAPAQGE
jgi:hypothetical protein